MAQKIQTLFIDDLDGSAAEGTVRFGLVLISPAGTPRGRENRVGLPADAGTFPGT